MWVCANSNALHMEMFLYTKLSHELELATPLGRVGSRLQISPTPSHCLSIQVLSSTGISSVHLLWHLWGCQGHLFLVVLTLLAALMPIFPFLGKNTLFSDKQICKSANVILEGRRAISRPKKEGLPCQVQRLYSGLKINL